MKTDKEVVEADIEKIKSGVRAVKVCAATTEGLRLRLFWIRANAFLTGMVIALVPIALLATGTGDKALAVPLLIEACASVAALIYVKNKQERQL